MDPQVVLDKVVRIAKMDMTVFDEVKADAQQTIPAIVVAAISILIFGLGGWFWWMTTDYKDISGLGVGDILLKSVILGGIISFGLWFAWIIVSYSVLTSVLKATSDVQMLIRTMGYASVGFAIGFLFLIPKLGFAFGLGGLMATFALTNYAIQATTTASPKQVMVANLAGFLVWALVLSLLATMGDKDTYAPNLFLTWGLAGR